MSSPSQFDSATALLPDADGGLVGAVHPGWDINGNANGGYLLALVAAGLRTVSGRPDPVTVTAHYLRPAPAGPCLVRGEVVKSGKRFTTVTGSLLQDERERIRVLAAFGDLSAPAGSFVRMDGGPPDLPRYEDCVARQAGGDGFPVALLDKLDVRLHPDDAAFQRGDRTGEAVIRGWFGFADGRPADTLALLFIADAFPPPVFNIDHPPGWVPTVELTVHVRAVPASGPLRCVFRTRFIQGGFLEEDGEVWDEAGVLVAQSRQLALLPRG